MNPIEFRNHYWYRRVQPDTFKVYYSGLYGQTRLYMVKLPIKGKIGPFRPYFDYIGPI